MAQSPSDIPLPHVLGYAWKDAIDAQDFDAAWELAHGTLRMINAQRWIHHNMDMLDYEAFDGADRESVASRVVEEVDSVPFIEGFKSMFVRDYGTFMDEGAWGLSSHGRTLTASIEAVVFVNQDALPVDENGFSYVPPGAAYVAVPVFTEEERGKLKVRGFGALYDPGWPPVEVDMDIDAY